MDRAKDAVAGLVRRAGTAPVSGPLLAAAAVHVALAALWRTAASPLAEAGFARSWGTWALGAVLALDALVAVGRATGLLAPGPAQAREAARGAADDGAVRILLAAGYLLAAVGFVASLAMRDRVELRCAVGEDCVAALDQAIARDPPRRWSPGPFPIAFRVDSVRGRAAARADGERVAMAVRERGGRTRTATALRPAWWGWGRLARPVAAGDTLRYEVSAERGTAMEGGFAKLLLDPAGATDAFSLQRTPHRVYVRAVEAAGGGAPRFQVAIYRGKLLLAESTVGMDEPIAFEGLALRLAEWRPWVQVELLRDPGIPLVLLGAAAALAALALRAWNRAAPGAPPAAA